MRYRTALVLAGTLFAAAASGATAQVAPGNNGSIVERDTDIAKPEAGTHDGGGQTVGYTYFEAAKDMKIVFRKRALKPGAAIGIHKQDIDEIYYIVSGHGMLTLDGKVTEVGPGTGILTRSGSTHGLKQMGTDDLVVIINFGQDVTAAPVR